MEIFHHPIWQDGKLFGHEVTFWSVVGWVGMTMFASRFFVQWYATEKRKQVVVPVLFWWLSLTGSLAMLSYAIFDDKHLVIILSYSLTWLPYGRNLILHYRHERSHRNCPECGMRSPPAASFCSQCGARIAPEEPQLKEHV